MTTKKYPPQTVFDENSHLKAELRKRDQLLEALREELEFTQRIAAKRLDQIHTLRQPRPSVGAAIQTLRDALFDLGPSGQYAEMETVGRSGYLQGAVQMALDLLQEAGR